ncbi:protein of unknown function [Streptantibioticus cattleyicolor NRRL 8057 = DSM 46488]|nr:protein of unknown function [Streptantibioticus cattleyicolor NRRL 8057 = DSM 46488]
MIAHLQRASDTAGLLTYLYGPGEQGNHTSPRLIAGDGHGAPVELLAEPGSLPYLAQALDAPVERLGARAPERPVWVCSVRSNPHQPDLTDAQWAAVARRLVDATGIAPDGDPDACRWIALRNQPRQVHVVATLAREDGSLHNAHRRSPCLLPPSPSLPSSVAASWQRVPATTFLPRFSSTPASSRSRTGTADVIAFPPPPRPLIGSPSPPAQPRCCALPATASTSPPPSTPPG